MSPPRIVVGVERSERTDDALALAQVLAAPAAARIVLAGACEFPSIALAGANIAGLFAEEAVAEARALVARRTEALRAAGLDVEEVLSTLGSPASLLQSAAEEHAAELVVIGSTHTTPRGRVLPGSTGELLLAGAPCAVAIAPSGYASGAHHGLKRIGVAFDGSDEARAALDAAAGLATRHGAALRVLTVLDVAGFGSPALMGGPGYDRLRADVEATAHAHLDEVVARLPHDVATDGRLLQGAPGRLLAEASADLDLLLMGSRGYGPLRAVLLGGVSGRLVREARCPLIVTPRGVTHPIDGLLDASEPAQQTRGTAAPGSW